VIFNKRLTYKIFTGIGDLYAKKAFLVPKDWLMESSRILQDNRF
jgi:hypothetical protein